MNAAVKWCRHQCAANWHLAPVILITGFVYLWFLSNGTFELFGRDEFGAVYDSMASHLARGKVDIGEEISGEAFQVNGRRYTYFLPAPAIPRIILDGVFRSMYGRWTRLFMLGLTMLSIWALIQLFRLIPSIWTPISEPWPFRRALECVFLLSASMGSTLMFLSSRAFIYHEAILWGSTWCVLTVLFTLKYWLSRRALEFTIACVCSCIAFYSRTTSGCGALALIAITGALGLMPYRLFGWARVPKESRPPGRHAFCAIVFLVVNAFLFLAYNHARFGSWFEPMPLRYHVQYTSERLRRIQGTLTHTEAIPTNLSAYWVGQGLAISDRFPWIAFKPSENSITSRLSYDVNEPHASVRASMPGLFLLTILGLVGAGLKAREDSRMGLIIGALIVGAVAVLASAAISERYIHDFFPLITISALVGMNLLATVKISIRYTGYVVLGTLLLCGVPVMLALTFRYQREAVWGVPEQRLRQLQTISELATGLIESVRINAHPEFARVVRQLPSRCYAGEMVASLRSGIYVCENGRWIAGGGEVQVMGASAGSNLAQGRPATQSSLVSPEISAGRAVDGNTDGNYYANSVTHTMVEGAAWWQVDLGGPATINAIRIWNRTDCCGDRLSDYWVLVSNAPFGTGDTIAMLRQRKDTWSIHETRAPDPATTIGILGGVQGRFVRVQLDRANPLSLAEVQVFGHLAGKQR